MCLHSVSKTDFHPSEKITAYKVVEYEGTAFDKYRLDTVFRPIYMSSGSAQFELYKTSYDHRLARFFPRLAKRFHRHIASTYSGKYLAGFHAFLNVNDARRIALNARPYDDGIIMKREIVLEVEMSRIVAQGRQNECDVAETVVGLVIKPIRIID